MDPILHTYRFLYFEHYCVYGICKGFMKISLWKCRCLFAMYVCDVLFLKLGLNCSIAVLRVYSYSYNYNTYDKMTEAWQNTRVLVHKTSFLKVVDLTSYTWMYLTRRFGLIIDLTVAFLCRINMEMTHIYVVLLNHLHKEVISHI